MRESYSEFKTDLQLSARWVSGLLIMLAMILLVVVEPRIPSEQRMPVRLYFLLLFVLAIIIWLLDAWRSWGRVGIIGLLIGAVFIADAWFGLPGALTLLAIPTALAVTLLGPSIAAVITLAETGILFLSRYGAPATEQAMVWIAVLVIWCVFGVVYAGYHLAHQVAEWSWAYYQRALAFMEETSNQREQLNQALDDLAHANRQLIAAAERAATLRTIAEEAQKSKTTFVANVSHEFRTPLNIIIGLVELMARTPEIYNVVLSPKMRKDLETLHRNCEHLSKMINDVLDLTRMEAGRLTLYRERVDLAEVINESVETVRPLIDNKRLGLEIRIPPNLPQVYCDRTRVRQVVLNLLSNASRFTETGGITVEVAQRDQDVLFSVTDTGPGISPEALERIFEPFWQSPGQLWRDKGGSGLGLSISKQFIELHGGRMWVNSQVGRGAAFYFTLPIDPPLEPVARAGHAIKEDWIWRERAFIGTKEAIQKSLPTRPRVVVWDETGALYPQLLRYSDTAEFVDAGDQERAVQELKAFPAQFLLLNTASPDTLWSMAERVAQSASETPIIGWSLSHEMERSVRVGALGYLIKPVTRADLEKAIANVGRDVRRVLVVDDDPDTLDLFTRLWHIYDGTIEVTTATDGRAALDQLRRAPPDLMLIDVIMPEMDGWHVVEAMRQDETIPNVPFYFVSAQDPADTPPRSRCLVATQGEGLSLNKLVRCSMEISRLILTTD